MLKRLVIKNFRNFTDEVEINISDLLDDYKFSVVVGRNGSGKSSLVAAIEWILFSKIDTHKNQHHDSNENISNFFTKAEIATTVVAEIFDPESGYS